MKLALKLLTDVILELINNSGGKIGLFGGAGVGKTVFIINNIAKALGVLVELESVLGKGMTYIWRWLNPRLLCQSLRSIPRYVSYMGSWDYL